MAIELVMPYNHLIFCSPPFSSCPQSLSIRVFSHLNEYKKKGNLLAYIKLLIDYLGAVSGMDGSRNPEDGLKALPLS